LTPEEKALQRFTVERQRKASKNSLFNLDDEQDGEMLTHYGQSLSAAPAPLADQEDLFRRALEKGDQSDEETTNRKRKSKAEVMEEVIAKSKAYKVRSTVSSLRRLGFVC
jgi:nucleolar protein 14